jgi:hypothetical protein
MKTSAQLKAEMERMRLQAAGQRAASSKIEPLDHNPATTGTCPVCGAKDGLVCIPSNWNSPGDREPRKWFDGIPTHQARIDAAKEKGEK